MEGGGAKTGEAVGDTACGPAAMLGLSTEKLKVSLRDRERLISRARASTAPTKEGEEGESVVEWCTEAFASEIPKVG